jgi:endonuclease/exonuclease/phosphatase family metal-dependent hydrolase
VLTWNVHQGYSSAKKHVNKAQLDLVASLAPDVVAFQELAEWDNDMPRLYRDGLTSRTGRPWTMHYEADIPDAPRNKRQGSAIATSLRVDHERIAHVGDRTAPDDQVRNRATVLLHVRVADETVAIATTHLDHLDTANRRAQLDQVQSLLHGAGRFRIVAGDFNADPEDARTFGAWQAEYQDAWTASANPARGTAGYTVRLRTQTKRQGRIDYQWYSGLEPLRVQLVETDLSDHHGVLVEWGLGR